MLFRSQCISGLITLQLGDEAGDALCALLKQTSPRIYRDQLVGLKSLLKRHEVSPALLTRLCNRPALTTTQIRDYLEAYAAHPERLEVVEKRPPEPASASPRLTRYAGIALQRQEVDHDKLH